MTKNTGLEIMNLLSPFEIQNAPLYSLLTQEPAYEGIEDEEWTQNDFKNFNEAYAIILSNVEDLKSALKVYEECKMGFEGMLRRKYTEKDEKNVYGRYRR